MHRFLGFLGTVILFSEMVNYAHADTGREDAATTRYAGPSLRPYVLPMHDLKPPVHSSSARDLGLFTQTPAVSPVVRSSPLLSSSLRKRVLSVTEHNEPRASEDANVPSKDQADSNSGQIMIPTFPVLPEVSSPRMDHQDNRGGKRIVDYVIAGALIGGILFYIIRLIALGWPGV